MAVFFEIFAAGDGALGHEEEAEAAEEIIGKARRAGAFVEEGDGIEGVGFHVPVGVKTEGGGGEDFHFWVVAVLRGGLKP